VDFVWEPHLVALAAEATALAASWSQVTDRREDSWLVGDDPAFSAELARRGWLGMTWPTAVGGGGRSALERFVVFEALIAGGAPVARSWFADRQIGPTLLQFGTDEQRAAYLPGIIDGTSSWCIGMSEPDAGSDVAAIATRAVRNGDTWMVDGQKIWTSGAERARYCYLVCRTDPDAPAHEGLSELIVPMDSPGITVVPITDATAGRHFCEVFFDGVQVPATNLVGTQNNAFCQIMRQMEHERGGIDRLVSNRALYLDAQAAADTTDPLVRQELAALESGYRIGRLLVLREVLGQAPRGFSAATKTFCTEFEQRVAAFCAQVAGPAALLDGRVATNSVYAPAYTLMGGTTQVLRNILGERVLGLPREPRSR
jgi:alkylation response protein AidB-like acyl-CoA dehydrogenase